jgi:hypothetical protein
MNPFTLDFLIISISSDRDEAIFVLISFSLTKGLIHLPRNLE